MYAMAYSPADKTVWGRAWPIPATSCGSTPGKPPDTALTEIYKVPLPDAPAPGAPGATSETPSSPLVVEFQLRPDPLAFRTGGWSRRPRSSAFCLYRDGIAA
jgi:hypothetical protein